MLSTTNMGASTGAKQEGDIGRCIRGVVYACLHDVGRAKAISPLMNDFPQRKAEAVKRKASVHIRSRID